jgi:hypothetical protein
MNNSNRILDHNGSSLQDIILLIINDIKTYDLTSTITESGSGATKSIIANLFIKKLTKTIPT